MIRSGCALACIALSSAGAFATSSRADAPLHHAIEARLDPASGALAVTDRLTLRERTRLDFRLADWIAVEQLRVDGRELPARQRGGIWQVPLPDAGAHEVELKLRGVVPRLPPPEQRDRVQSAVSGPEGSYLPSSAGWYAVTSDDWIAYRLSVEVPAPYRAVATGRLVEEGVGEAVRRAVFEANHPAEPPSLFAGPYTVQERSDAGVRIRTYLHSDLVDLAAEYLRASGHYLARYDQEIGPYPFADFEIVSSPLPVGLGFPNLTYIGRTVLPLPFMRRRSLAHEVLHNWWGNGVAIDYATGNWAEGLTTYMADYALAEGEGAERAQEMRLAWLRDFAALPAERDVAVTAFTSKRHDASQVVGYDKVAFIFHMLRAELGDAVFAEGLRVFWREQRFKIAGWAQLREAFGSVTDRDLDGFFDQWLTQSGAPQLSLGGVQVSEQGAGVRIVMIVHQRPPIYRLSVPVVIDTADGALQHRSVVAGKDSLIELTVPTAVYAVHLDPGYDLFRRLLPGETPPILRDVTLSPDALTFVVTQSAAANRSARQLAEDLLDTSPRFATTASAVPASVPLLIVGLMADVNAFLSRADLAGIPDALAGRGTARVWTARRSGSAPLLVVAADDLDALEALRRPLPHYGGKSYLVFEGSRALETGLWPVTDSPLSRRIRFE